MAQPVYFPKVGMTMEEGTLLRWIAPEGSEVHRGQPLFELETEKVSIEVEADGEGTLRRLVAEGAALPPGAVVGCLLASGETEVPDAIAVAAGRSAGSAPANVVPASAVLPAEQAPSQPSERVLASPYVRKIAREQGVELEALSGTGPGGRVTEDDVRAYVAAKAAPAVAVGEADGPAAASFAGTASTPYSGRRRTIGERMLSSVRSAPQVTLISEVRIDEAADMLHGLNREWRPAGIVVTLPMLVTKACALALREHPRLAAHLQDGAIVEDTTGAIGLATDHPDGLMVPVVQHAAELSLEQLARRVAELLDRTRDATLAPEDVQGGAFTVTSMDGTVVDAFTPIINPPQAAILGLGRVREVPAFRDGAVERARVTTFNLTFDHRITDGAPAARFLARLAELLGRPYLLM